ncbi:MAG: hypothetical protein CVU03_02120 [Bacteroidetes bacterium HGW-Bacteroidetes-2]|jgi:hypothetical protein|nr:MAG: hypothetical protein CVU13_06200 [Bacteroidetes bacterium HGW-Bacteroidetes-8]PKP26693.1 MAG: hypothetical protein CVU03_02120 [Bacteroidetes bacterium HGW-Bacteroidetes-2]
MPMIEWWLLKYSDHYKSAYDFFYNQNLYEIEEGSVMRLNLFGKPTDQKKFLELYEALDKVSGYHRNEAYFEQEMVDYNKIKKSQSDLKKWVIKNEYLGADKYVCFFVDYLDYDKNNEEEHLSVFVLPFKELDIYIDRQYFKNTIEFLEIFNELFWSQEIYPESPILQSINLEMNTNRVIPNE